MQYYFINMNIKIFFKTKFRKSKLNDEKNQSFDETQNS